MERIFIDNTPQLQALLTEALLQPRIAVDLESDGLFRYRPRLCTLQLQVNAQLVVVDTLAIEDLSLLAPLLSEEGPQKVIHDLSFDARMLRRQGLPLGNVFDTALTARLLGLPATGLSALLKTYCNVQVDKELQQYDWGRRPLEPHTLDYLYEDVAHLFNLQDALQQEVENQGIMEELRAETHYTLAQALQEPSAPPKPPWLRVKRAQHLSPLEQAVLRALCNFREDVAAERNVPPFRVLHDRMLLQLATIRPRNAGALRRGPARLPSHAQPLIPGLLAAIHAGVNQKAPPTEDLASVPPPPPAGERSLRRKVEKALSSWRKAEAQRREVDPQVILPGHALHDLAQHRPKTMPELEQVAGLGQGRIERYGSQWLTIVEQQQADNQG